LISLNFSIPGVSDHHVIVDGKNISIALFDENDIVSNAIMNGGWENSDIAGIVKKLDELKAAGGKDLIFLDIGSNVGWFSINVASHGYKTISFDAMRTNGHILRTSICNNPHLELCQ
jgi:hypothetical protein